MIKRSPRLRFFLFNQFTIAVSGTGKRETDYGFNVSVCLVCSFMALSLNHQ